MFFLLLFRQSSLILARKRLLFFGSSQAGRRNQGWKEMVFVIVVSIFLYLGQAFGYSGCSRRSCRSVALFGQVVIRKLYPYHFKYLVISISHHKLDRIGSSKAYFQNTLTSISTVTFIAHRGDSISDSIIHCVCDSISHSCNQSINQLVSQPIHHSSSSITIVTSSPHLTQTHLTPHSRFHNPQSHPVRIHIPSTCTCTKIQKMHAPQTKAN